MHCFYRLFHPRLTLRKAFFYGFSSVKKKSSPHVGLSVSTSFYFNQGFRETS